MFGNKILAKDKMKNRREKLFQSVRKSKNSNLATWFFLQTYLKNLKQFFLKIKNTNMGKNSEKLNLSQQVI